MDFNAASQRLVRFSLPAQLFNLFKSRFAIFKVFRYTIEIAVCVRGDDAGRVSPFATFIGMIAALTKDKNAAVALNNVNGGGK